MTWTRFKRKFLLYWFPTYCKAGDRFVNLSARERLKRINQWDGNAGAK